MLCFTVIINQDNLCENNPSDNFFVNLDFESGIPPIDVFPDRAVVGIDDDGEPECRKFTYFTIGCTFSN